MNDYHIVPILNGWALRQAHSETTITTAEIKEHIIAKAADLLEGKVASVKIHRRDGTIEEERTYPRSSDPARSKG